MAVNNGCPDCQLTYGQFSNHGGHDQEESRLQRERTASPENVPTSPTIFNPYYTGTPRPPANANKSLAIDRQEIIRRIKKGGSRPTSPELERPSSSHLGKKREYTPLLVSKAASPEARPQSPESRVENQSIGLQIERPRSALHRGDFREKEQAVPSIERFGGATRPELTLALSTSPVVPWHPDFPVATCHVGNEPRYPLIETGFPFTRPTRSRAASNASLAATFIYQPPTSPLAQSSRPDTPETTTRRKSRSPDKSRRHTFSPQSFQSFRSALDYTTTPLDYSRRRPPPLRSEKSAPYQAHQPRRSLNAASFSSYPLTPLPGSRRPSFSESPLHHAPMVGSYEESILRGRMSTTPSKPLNFVAQIGVLGKGNCKSNLRCPPHVSVPFPAVFYSYGSSNKNMPMSDQPSPYVGLVDLENNLPSTEVSQDKRRQRLQAATRTDEVGRASSRTGAEESTSDTPALRRRRQKQKRRSGSPKAPPGGSYRIPEQGQLQIVIKNPNKTAVKLFLVPYDLSDMEPGQKTFIRQRSYSAGPIIDMPLSSRNNLGTDRPEAAINTSDDPNDRPVLRYLVHLHICCPSKRRYFLYKSIRVVFANRVPDGKERLRNEIQLPEPRYSSYKPGRDSNVNVSAATGRDPGRRQSGQESSTPPGSDVRWPGLPRNLAQSLPSTEYNLRYDVPMQALPHPFNALPTLQSRPASRQMSDGMEGESDKSHDTQFFQSPVSSPNPDKQQALKSGHRLEDPFQFERETNREQKSGARNESLLSKRLMDLAFQNQYYFNKDNV